MRARRSSLNHEARMHYDLQASDPPPILLEQQARLLRLMDASRDLDCEVAKTPRARYWTLRAGARLEEQGLE
ncbi:MAG: hypothetical protein ACREKS_03195 [Candidatus Rokuibacteriota bacterium]